MSTSWQPPLAKLLGLLVLLPFTVTYLHLYYFSYWKSEYCFVGPHVSMVSGQPYHDSFLNGMNPSPVDTVESGNATGQQGVRENELALFHGIYAPIPQKKKRDVGSADRRQFRQKYAATSLPSNASPSRWFGSRGWPSITEASMMVPPPSSHLSNHHYLYRRQALSETSDHFISFVDNEEENRWCLQSSSHEMKWCSDPLPSYPDGTVYSYPPSGVWKPAPAASSSSKSFSSSSLSISCPTPATSNRSKNSSRHKRQNSKQNQNVQFILNQPATVLLLLLNTGLAFHYWNHRISPSSVCKQYTKIVTEHEWWRGFTGATAHFEPLHIGFNMMSLNNLGRELEGGFGSVVFLVYNVALILFSTLVMMALVYARLRWIQYKLDRTSDTSLKVAFQEQKQRLRETSTVGYSAVLFAWMVVSTMERKQPTCPIPFFSDVCFSTYSVPGLPFLKFNVSPIVSLFLAQFIMPRVSFIGHLAGIICGFCLHWGWTAPPLEVCSPNVLIGGAFLLGLIWRRRVIPVRPLLTAKMDEEGCSEHEDYLISLLADAGENDDVDSSNPPLGRNRNPNGSGLATDPLTRSKEKKEREVNEIRRKRATLLSLRNLMGIETLASLFVFDWRSSLVISHCILLVFFTCGIRCCLFVWAYTHSRVETDVMEPEKNRSGMIWRGVHMTAILSLVVDSMSLASWFALPTLIAAEKCSLPIGLGLVFVFMTLRTAVNVFVLVLSSKILHDLSQVQMGAGGGIFFRSFSKVIKLAKLVGDQILVPQTMPSWTAFEGRGVTLGR